MLTRGGGSGDKGVFNSDVIWLKYCRNGVNTNQSIDQSDHAVTSKKNRSYSRSWVKATYYSLNTSEHLSLSRDYMCVCSAAVSQRARDVTKVHVARTLSLNECSNGRGEGRARLLSDADRAPIYQNSPAAMSISEAAQRGKIERSLVSKINKLKFLQSPI